jgi:filamentous hemagglutinin
VANGDKSKGEGNLTATGANLSAGKEATLDASGDLNLLASANTATSRSTNSSSNASMGATFALGGAQNGLSFQSGAQGSKGRANGDEVAYNNTTVTVGTAQTPGTLNLKSGGNTTLRGATANADTLNADIKGNLAIESLQDKASYDSKQTSAGVSICIPPICYGTMVAVNVNASKTKADSSLKSVTEQSGLMAGDGGFNVKVGGNTKLTGGFLASSDQAIKDGKNSFTTATLTTRDLDNHASASASSTGFSASSSMASEGMYGAAKAVVSNALNNADTSGNSSGQTKSAISIGLVTITNEAAQQALTGKTGEQTVAALNRDTASAHTGAAAQNVKAMEKKVEAERAITQATVAEALKFTDETYRKLFVEKHPMYEVMKDKDGKTVLDEKTGRPILRELSEQEKTTLQPGSDGKVHISTNGIFNDKEAAGTYADQHNTTTGPQYVIYFPEANNVVSELMVAGYQKYLESTAIGLSNSTLQVRDAMNQYGQTGLQLDGHSRGAMTIGNGIESQAASQNAQGSLSNTTINFFGPAYNAQQADNLLSTLQDRASLPAAQQPDLVLQFQNHTADPVGGFIGRNPGTGGTIPEDSSTPVEAIRAATGQPVTVHNCYGQSLDQQCGAFWRDTGGQLKSAPVPAIPAREVPR